MTADSSRDIGQRMEKRWGLDLDMSAVRLMRREDDAWVEVAIEKIDGPDIETRLVAMIEQIETDAAVQLFLPRDQILYTQVELGPVGDTRAQIERAMDGRTPYPLGELSLDWELTASGSARVAAIAYETLDEAAAFAEVRGLAVSGYSSLSTPDDFPRAPVFDGPNIVAPSSEDAAPAQEPIDTNADAVTFTSARKPSRPPGAIEPVPEDTSDAGAANERLGAPLELADPVMPASAPVVHVDDDTPVMAVRSPSQPLDPGAPIASEMATPRIRTDIAAGTFSGSAASLTPPISSVKVRRGSSIASIAMIFAAVFVLAIGIATLVWTLLPMSPSGSTDGVPAASQSGENEAATAPETEIAAFPDTTDDAEPAPEAEVANGPTAIDEPDTTEDAPQVVEVPDDAPVEPEAVVEDTAPEVPDAPQPIVQEVVALIEAPTDGAAPALATVADAPLASDVPQLLTALQPGEALPAYDPNTPFPATPPELAGIAVSAPFPGPLPETGETTDDIYIASIETSDLASDAIALPSVFGLKADALPAIAVPPVQGEETVVPEVASLENIDKLEPSQETDDAMAAAVAQALADALAGPAGLIPTKLASAIPQRAPKARPGGFVEDIERGQFGGRTRSELLALRPPPRPASVQSAAAENLAPPSELAVALSLPPRGRPENFGAMVRAALVQREAERLSASVNTRAPDTSSAVEAALDRDTTEQPRQPRRLNIPTNASVARQATIENAIRLNRINLVGVYGAPSNRRALVRLSSGRYIKLKVGDRIDGGTVARITDNELLYNKGRRTLSLSLPKG